MSAGSAGSSCSGKAESNAQYFVGLGLGAVSTELKFDNDQSYDFEQGSTSLIVGLRLPSAWVFRGSIGVIAGGRLTNQNSTGMEDEISLETGIAGGLGVSRQWWFSKPYFASASFDLAASRSKSNSMGTKASFVGTDMRIGGRIGRSFSDRFTVYASTRLFGGPVMWSDEDGDILGSDRFHFQLGGGAMLQWEKLSFFVDISGLGEKAASLGLSYLL